MNMLLLSQSCVAPASARATRAAVATALAAVAAAAATASTASSAATTKASSSSSLSSPAAPVAAIAAAAASSLTNAATQALSGCAAAVAAVAKLWTRCKMALLRLLGLACAPSDDTTADDGADATLTHAHVDGASRDDDGQGQTSQDAKDQGEDARQPTQLAEAVRDDQDDQDDQDEEDDDEASLRAETTTASTPTTTKIAETTETAETAEPAEPAETAVATTTTACAPTLESDSNSNDPSDASDSNETEPEPEASVLAAEQPETQGAAPDALLDAYRAAVTTRHAALGSFPFDTVLQIVIRLHEEFHGHAIRLDGALQDGPGYSKDENALALVDVVVDALRYMEYDPERTLASLLDDWLPQHHAYTWFCAKDFTDAKAAERRSGLFTLYAL